VCRCYCPGPNSEVITVPVLPKTLQQDALCQVHNVLYAGHQGQDKTLQRLCLNAYWVGMSSDVNKHCQNCINFQQAKLPSPTKAPLVSLPVGRPWEMLAVDVLEIPLSTKDNHYLFFYPTEAIHQRILQYCISVIAHAITKILYSKV